MSRSITSKADSTLFSAILIALPIQQILVKQCLNGLRLIKHLDRFGPIKQFLRLKRFVFQEVEQASFAGAGQELGDPVPGRDILELAGEDLFGDAAVAGNHGQTFGPGDLAVRLELVPRVTEDDAQLFRLAM